MNTHKRQLIHTRHTLKWSLHLKLPWGQYYAVIHCTQIREQVQIQNQMIQSMINMSLNNPEVMKGLLAMVKEQDAGTSRKRVSVVIAQISKVNNNYCFFIPLLLQTRRNSTAFVELQTELLKAQEQQRQETQQHFATQAEFQAAMKKQLEEQAKMQMMVNSLKGVERLWENGLDNLTERLHRSTRHAIAKGHPRVN